MIDQNYAIELLMLANGLLLAIACFAVARFDRRCRQIETFWASPTGSAIADAGDEQFDAQLRSTQRLEQRVGELQRAVKVVELKSNDSVGQVGTRTTTLPIDNAVRMAKQGASVEELTRNCGLNIGEAKLMQKLHGQAPGMATGS